MSINRATTVSFLAIDFDGVASPIVSRAFEKAPSWEDRQTATLTQHFIAGRLTVDQYVAIGLDLGFNAVVTLYLIDGKWVLNPTSAQDVRTMPLRARTLTAAGRAAPGGIAIAADKPSGQAAESFDVSITASSTTGDPVTVYYTEDGTDPSDKRNPSRRSFEIRKTFAIRGDGHHSVLCYAEHATRNGVFESFAWTVDAERSKMGRTGKSRQSRVPA